MLMTFPSLACGDNLQRYLHSVIIMVPLKPIVYVLQVTICDY